jgi:hypothetical protein
MGLWRIKEQKHSNCYATKDSDYDKITEFKNKNKAHHYYVSVFNNNYRTVLEEQVDNKWQYRAASCCSEFA